MSPGKIRGTRGVYARSCPYLDLRPALERARRAAYDRRVFCERTPTVNEKKGRKKLSDLFFSPSEDTVGDMDKRPQLPNQTPRGAQWTFLGNLPGGSFRIWPRSLYFLLCVRLNFPHFRLGELSRKQHRTAH